MPEKHLVIGALVEPIHGPGVIVHEGGDNLLVAPVVDGFAQDETVVTFEGADVREGFDDQVFTPYGEEQRSIEIGEVAHVRARGQANIVLKTKDAEPAPKPVAKKKAAKKAAKKDKDDAS